MKYGITVALRFHDLQEGHWGRKVQLGREFTDTEYSISSMIQSIRQVYSSYKRRYLRYDTSCFVSM